MKILRRSGLSRHGDSIVVHSGETANFSSINMLWVTKSNSFPPPLHISYIFAWHNKEMFCLVLHCQKQSSYADSLSMFKEILARIKIISNSVWWMEKKSWKKKS